MYLEETAHFNQLSATLRTTLEERIKSFGKTVRYKFDLSRPNPDPTNYNGKTIWPSMYTLDPAVFDIIDPHEKSTKRSKRIGYITGVDEKGTPNKFKKIQVYAKDKGELFLNISESQDDFYTAMILELHPKQKGGLFQDVTKHLVFSRIDEKAYATEQKSLRTLRVKALNAAQNMSDKEANDFNDAMQWEEGRDIEVVKNDIEALADTDPGFFNDLIAGKDVEYRATVRKAIALKHVIFEPSEYKFTWAGNKQTITVLSPAGEENEVIKMSNWLQTGGKTAEEAYKKIQSLNKTS